MGGEQYSVLVFGPKIAYDIEKWFDIFNLVDKKEWIEKFMNNNAGEFEDYEFELVKNKDMRYINITFNQYFYDNEDIDKYEILLKWLKVFELCLDYVFDNNVDWSEFLIGYIVKDYIKFTEIQKEKVINFCKKYNLPEPTFFGAIIGEFE